jgi:eukaryotic-like serine/threonine-protein kinase
MAVPTTVDDFLTLCHKSGLVDKRAVEGFCQRLRGEGEFPATPKQIAVQMLREGLLTGFQGEYLLAGKWRGFIIAGKYRLLDRVGVGGMGSVYLCEHIVMKRRVALKVLPAALAEDPTAVARFHREAQAVAALDHPNIVRAHDIDCESKLHFLVMEYVDGSSFQEIVKRLGPMDVVRAAHYIAQASCGLEHAHEAGIVHRDIKPGNILVDRNGAVKILDMGLARFFHDEEDELTEKHESSSVLGTADYLAPEQALDSHDVDIRADIYSLGATMYFLLAGKSPFQDGSVAQKLIWHQVRQPKPIQKLRPEVPAEMAAVIAKMMAKDPGERYQTPAEVVAALSPWTQAPIAPPPEEEMPQLGKAALGEWTSRSAASSQRLASQILKQISKRGSEESGDSCEGPSSSDVPMQAGSTARGPGLRANADTPRSSPRQKPRARRRVGDEADVFNRTKPEAPKSSPQELPKDRGHVPFWLIVSAICGFTLLAIGVAILWLLVLTRG